MNNYPKVTVILVNWNGSKDTIECLRSLREIQYQNFKVLIVDNGSTEADVSMIERECKNEVIIKTSENLGFSYGCNSGIRYVLSEGSSKYILLLNNDTIVDSEFLTHLVDAAESCPGAGAIGAKIFLYSSPSKIWYEAGKISLLRGLGYHVKRLPWLAKNILDTGFITGCAMLIPIEVVQKVGYFDEKYFLYQEDVDYCYRLKKSGYKLKVAMRSIVYHKVIDSGKNVARLYYLNRNRLYFMIKKVKELHYLLVFVPWFIMTRIVKIVLCILGRRLKDSMVIINAIKDGVSGVMGKKAF